MTEIVNPKRFDHPGRPRRTTVRDKLILFPLKIVRDRDLIPAECCHRITLDSCAADQPAQPNANHQDKDDQPPYAEAQVSSPRTRDAACRHDGRFPGMGALRGLICSRECDHTKNNGGSAHDKPLLKKECKGVAECCFPVSHELYQNLSVCSNRDRPAVGATTCADHCHGNDVARPITKPTGWRRSISLVPDEDIRTALKDLFEAQGVVVEPSSAITLAFVKARAEQLEEPICVILTGENIAREDHRRLISAAREA